MDKVIYLDNAATTFPKPDEVYSTMDYYLRNKCVNAGRSSYKLARESNEIINETRKLIGDIIFEGEEKVVFTPSATIAFNQILGGLEWESIQNVYVSPFEHNAIMRTLKYKGIDAIEIPFDPISFELDTQKFKIMLSERKPDLLLMSHVSNVTGYILPVNEISKLVNKYNPITIIDAAQSFGIVDIAIDKEYYDFIVFAGHKSLYGPFGASGFINNYKGSNVKPYIVGGTGSDSTNLDMPSDTPYIYEPGSYNTYAISGLNASLKWMKRIGSNNIYNHKKELSNILIDKLSKLEGIELYIPKNKENHIGIVSFNIEGFDSEDIGKILDDEFNIAVRTGHHCAPRIGKFLKGQAEKGTVRISLGYFNTIEDIEAIVEAVEDIIGG